MVLVCHPNRFVFLKTRKTASTSVEMYLERFCVPVGHPYGSETVSETITDAGIVGARRGGQREGDTWRNHMSASRVRARLGASLFDGYTKVTTVRNPWARVLSQYLWATGRGYPASEEDLALVRTGLERFLSEAAFRDDRDIVCIDGRVVVDRFVRFEALAEDLRELCARLGVGWYPEDLVVTKRGAGDRTAFALQDYFTRNAADRVTQAFDWLLARFDYSLTDPIAAARPRAFSS